MSSMFLKHFQVTFTSQFNVSLYPFQRLTHLILSPDLQITSQFGFYSSLQTDFNEYSFFFFFGCVGSSLLRVGFLQLRRAGATLRCSSFSCCRAWAVGTWAFIVVARGLSSCGSRGQLLCGMWDLPRPGLEPMSPALAGGFLTTAPPGKSPEKSF